MAIAAEPARASAARPPIRGALGQPTASHPAPAARVPVAARPPCKVPGLPVLRPCSLATSQLRQRVASRRPRGTWGGRYFIYRPPLGHAEPSDPLLAAEIKEARPNPKASRALPHPHAVTPCRRFQARRCHDPSAPFRLLWSGGAHSRPTRTERWRAHLAGALAAALSQALWSRELDPAFLRSFNKPCHLLVRSTSSVRVCCLWIMETTDQAA